MGLQTFEVCLCISLVLTLVVARRQHSLGWISYLLPNLVTKSVVLELIFRSLWGSHLHLKKKKKVTEGEPDYSVSYPIPFFTLANWFYYSLYLHKIFLNLWLCKPHSLVLGGIYDLFVQLSRAHLVTYVIDLENVVGLWVCGSACKLSTRPTLSAGPSVRTHLCPWSHYLIQTHFRKANLICFYVCGNWYLTI